MKTTMSKSGSGGRSSGGCSQGKSSMAAPAAPPHRRPTLNTWTNRAEWLEAWEAAIEGLSDSGGPSSPSGSYRRVSVSRSGGGSSAGYGPGGLDPAAAATRDDLERAWAVRQAKGLDRPTPTRSRFSVPEDANRVCPMEGTPEECPGPWIDRQGGLNLSEDDLDSARRSFETWWFTDEEEALLVLAWALLRRNEDILRWAVCQVMGASWQGDCVVRLLHGGTGALKRLLIAPVGREEDGLFAACGDRWFASAWIAAIGQWSAVGLSLHPQMSFLHAMGWFTPLLICTAHPVWPKWLELVRSGRPEAVACAVVDAACLLFHEMTHVCLYQLDDRGAAGRCARSFQMENVVRWALLQRYSFALDEPCCEGLDDGDNFNEFNNIDIRTSTCM